jgi:hypothetical protein
MPCQHRWVAQRWVACFLPGGWLTGCTIHDDQTQLTVSFPHGGSEVKLGCRVEPAGWMGTERSVVTGRGCGRVGAVRTAARRPSQRGRRASRRCRCEAPAAPPPQHPPASAPTGSSGTCAPNAPPPPRSPITIANANLSRRHTGSRATTALCTTPSYPRSVWSGRSQLSRTGYY